MGDALELLRGVVFEINAHIDVHALMRSGVGRTSRPASDDTDPERHRADKRADIDRRIAALDTPSADRECP